MKRASSDLGLVEKVFRLNGKEQLLGRIEWVEADLLDIFSLDDALKGVDEVYHCGAMVSFHPALRKQMHRVNIEGTANLVNACLDASVKKFCHVSSVVSNLSGKHPNATRHTPFQNMVPKRKSGEALPKASKPLL